MSISADIRAVLCNERAWHVECGNAIDLLRTLPDGCIHCCVTSPPYFALRSYIPGDSPLKVQELGQERLPDCRGWANGVRCGECYVCSLTALFGEVYRVLRNDGTLWLNVAGSYAQTTTRNRYGCGSSSALQDQPKMQQTNHINNARSTAVGDWKAKDYINVPALLAESLRADGWYLRSEIALTKLSPMPESVTDRPTRATEKLYLFARSPRYYYDQEAERVPHLQVSLRRVEPHRAHPGASERRGDVVRPTSPPNTLNRDQMCHAGGRNLWDYWDDDPDDLPSDVWVWNSEPSKLKHYAAFPTWLPRRCVRLGASLKGCCAKCGAPWRRLVKCESVPPARTTLGWQSSCQCESGDPVGCVVLDPFSGSGTTGCVAVSMGMRFIGLELNPEYAEMSRKRIGNVTPLFNVAGLEGKVPVQEQRSLFAEEDAE